MMEELEFGPWVVQVDREATRAAYAAVRKGAPEECKCTGCQNFVVTREQAYPRDALELFDTLGIDYRKEAEVYELGPQGTRHLYGGWFHFVGAAKERDAEEGARFGKWRYKNGVLAVEVLDQSLPSGFNFYFSNNPVQVSPSFENCPLVQLEFETEVPWVIEASEP